MVLVLRLDHRPTLEDPSLIPTKEHVGVGHGLLNHRHKDRRQHLKVSMGLLHPSQEVIRGGKPLVLFTVGVFPKFDLDQIRRLPEDFNTSQPNLGLVSALKDGQHDIVLPHYTTQSKRPSDG